MVCGHIPVIHNFLQNSPPRILRKGRKARWFGSIRGNLDLRHLLVSVDEWSDKVVDSTFSVRIYPQVRKYQFLLSS